MDKFNYNLEYLDSLIPYEREIYINLKVRQLNEANKK